MIFSMPTVCMFQLVRGIKEAEDGVAISANTERGSVNSISHDFDIIMECLLFLVLALSLPARVASSP